MRASWGYRMSTRVTEGSKLLTQCYEPGANVGWLSGHVDRLIQGKSQGGTERPKPTPGGGGVSDQDPAGCVHRRLRLR